ncbi:MAG: DUF2267 domain-containing protein [Oscillospiraceae bacterium]|jgi:hypothetical protein|nr:DUF2267 domain-containing protein [Oscillospiraceae bacterium]
MGAYHYDGDGAFVIEGFDLAPAFMSFLPGVSGELGVPMWLYYANRGQGVCSFGVDHKDHAIMEFSPANTALRRVASEGFRTFIHAGAYEFEPFSPARAAKRTMKIYPNSFQITEHDGMSGLSFTVRYFTMPGEDFPALARCCELTNLSGGPLVCRVLDGMPQILPYGVDNSAYKSVSNLFKSWAHVSGLETGLPVYHTRSLPGDEAEVSDVMGGYFTLSFTENGKPVIPVVDPESLFDTAFTKPRHYPEEAGADQIFANRYACAFTPLSSDVPAGGALRWTTYAGFAGDPDALRRRVPSLCEGSFVERKYKEALALTDALTRPAGVRTAEPMFDGYLRQCYLDNVLRGGEPRVLGGKVLHLYSRKHGDPERDYNFFSISAEYFSQGNGGFRDVCQNRRNDVFFRPEAGEANIRLFFSLVQADGFNPLEVRGATFTHPSKPDEPFTAGSFVHRLCREEGLSPEEAAGRLEAVLAESTQNINAAFGEGYWIDHWTYLLDLVENFLAIFPERKRELLGSGGYRFFQPPVRVLPRREAYVRKGGKLRQYKSLEPIEGRAQSAWLRNRDGSFAETTLLGKMAVLALVKFASLDPLGRGLEMDGGKPGWNDAMNGLPGLFGSGVGETYELKRLLTFLLGVEGDAALPAEAAELFGALLALQDTEDRFAYWNAAASAKEAYRAQVCDTLSGGDVTVPEGEWHGALERFLSRLNRGLADAEAMGEPVPTYLTYEPAGFDETGFPTGFTCRALPPFLEGPARQMKAAPEKARRIYDAVRACGLYDQKLGMYKTSVSLEGETYDIGRVRAFTPGWLERESVFLHMSLKYLLELLKAGLYDEFFTEIKTGLPPFLDPAVYGRNPLENSSFLASSINPDPAAAGRGFVARLSGSTAEALSLWRYLFLGGECFSVAPDGALRLAFAPVLPGWLFPEDGRVSFSLFSSVRVEYVNPGRKSTYGPGRVKPRRIEVFLPGGGSEVFHSAGGEAHIEGDTAKAVREGRAVRVDVDLV